MEQTADIHAVVCADETRVGRFCSGRAVRPVSCEREGLGSGTGRKMSGESKQEEQTLDFSCGLVC